MQTCQGLVTTVLSNLEQEPFMNVEVVLRVFYMLGEVVTDKVCVHQFITCIIYQEIFAGATFHGVASQPFRRK